MQNNLLITSALRQFESYKVLGEKAMEQLNDDNLRWQYNQETNSIVTIVKHMAGNMRSRWTDFLTTDGEKDWRKREAEFENQPLSQLQLMELWDEGWKCLFDTLNTLTDSDLQATIQIRNQALTVANAIHRQLAHYGYHVGQIVFIAKMLVNQNWKSLSIQRGKTKEYNTAKFSEKNW